MKINHIVIIKSIMMVMIKQLASCTNIIDDDNRIPAHGYAAASSQELLDMLNRQESIAIEVTETQI